MSISGAKAFSIFDDDDSPGTSPTAGTVVQFNHIEQNGEFYHRGVGEDDLNGSFIFAGDESLFEVGVTETTGLDQLRTWMEDKTLLKMCLAGLQENILWYEPTTVKIEKTYNFAVKNRNYHTVRLKVDKGGKHDIWSGINLLHGQTILDGFSGAWEDGDSDNVADGYQIEGGTPSFSDPDQKLSGSGSGSIRGDFKFPIAGVDLKFSIVHGFLHNETSSVVSQIWSMGHGSTFLSDNLKEFLSTGRNEIDHTTVPNIYTVRAYILKIPSSTTTTDDIGGKFPAIRTDDSDKYIAG